MKLYKAYFILDPSCMNNGVRLASEGQVDICSEGFRVGLCYKEIIQDPEAAVVLCRELGVNASNPGMINIMMIS